MAERKDGDGWQEYHRLREQIEAAKADEMRRLNEWCEELSQSHRSLNDKLARIDVAVARVQGDVTHVQEAVKKLGGPVSVPARGPEAGFYSGLASLLVAVATALWVLLQKGQ